MQTFWKLFSWVLSPNQNPYLLTDTSTTLVFGILITQKKKNTTKGCGYYKGNFPCASHHPTSGVKNRAINLHEGIVRHIEH